MKSIETLTTIFIIIIIIPIIATMIPTGSYKFMTVTGSSMEPTITESDIVVIDTSKIQPVVGDIMSYRYQLENGHIIIITHRAVSVVKEGYRTKGDAYTTQDNYIITPEDVIGIMSFKIPYIGALVHFAGTAEGFLTLVIFPIVILILPKKT